jgi:hypothetical protein
MGIKGAARGGAAMDQPVCSFLAKQRPWCTSPVLGLDDLLFLTPYMNPAAKRAWKSHDQGTVEFYLRLVNVLMKLPLK